MLLRKYIVLLRPMLRVIATTALLFFLQITLQAQNNNTNPEDRDVDMDSPTFVPMVKVGKVKQGSDSIQYLELNNIWVYPEPVFSDDRQRQAYNRLVYNVKLVLPIAKEVNRIIIETGDYLDMLPNKRARDLHMKQVEKLTYAQGKLLIRLVYRECNSSSYELIQGFLGPIRAGFWQTFAYVFGASLKKEYDPNGIDRLTERIVRQVEAGQI